MEAMGVSRRFPSHTQPYLLTDKRITYRKTKYWHRRRENSRRFFCTQKSNHGGKTHEQNPNQSTAAVRPAARYKPARDSTCSTSDRHHREPDEQLVRLPRVLQGRRLERSQHTETLDRADGRNRLLRGACSGEPARRYLRCNFARFRLFGKYPVGSEFDPYVRLP